MRADLALLRDGRRQAGDSDRFRLKDGGGVWSDADWMSPRGAHSWQGLRQSGEQRVVAWSLIPRLLDAADRCPLLSDDEVPVLRRDIVSFLRQKGWRCTAAVTESQPFTLEVWGALRRYLNDCDAGLPDILQRGAPAGILTDIPVSGVWHPVERPVQIVHDEPWASATDDPGCLVRLVQADIDAGFAEWLPGGLDEVRRRFGAYCAAGKLGLVKKEGSEPRFVGDSSISHANQLCQNQEKVELPSLHDVAEFVSRHQDTC